jgi:hypothetical protein
MSGVISLKRYVEESRMSTWRRDKQNRPFQIRTIDPPILNLGPAVHNELSKELLERVSRLQRVLAAVDS